VKTVRVSETRVVGISVRTRNADEGDPAKAKIGGLWQRFYKEGVAGKIPGATDPTKVFAVYTDYESDHRGAYTLVVGCPVGGSSAVPAGMVAATIPAGDYDVFEAKGEMPKALIETWGAIWKHYDGGAAKRAYTTDFEVHEKGSARVHIAKRPASD
jgi:predicted transcriptional regulator YdeE